MSKRHRRKPDFKQQATQQLCDRSRAKNRVRQIAQSFRNVTHYLHGFMSGRSPFQNLGLVARMAPRVSRVILSIPYFRRVVC